MTNLKIQGAIYSIEVGKIFFPTGVSITHDAANLLRPPTVLIRTFYKYRQRGCN